MSEHVERVDLGNGPIVVEYVAKLKQSEASLATVQNAFDTAGEQHCEETPLTIEELIYTLIEALVDNPDKLSLDILESGTVSMVTIKGDEDSIRFLLGRQGKTIAAIRLIASAMGARLRRSVRVDVLDPKRQDRRIPRVQD